MTPEEWYNPYVVTETWHTPCGAPDISEVVYVDGGRLGDTVPSTETWEYKSVEVPSPWNFFNPTSAKGTRADPGPIQPFAVTSYVPFNIFWSQLAE